MSIHLVHNNFIHNVREQGFSTSEKVRALSENYMVSYLAKALVASAALSCLGFSFSTAFPICLALIILTSFMSFALDSIKEAMHVLAQKSRACLARIAQVINSIFEKICAFISSFALQATHLTEKALSFDKKLPINYAVITDTETFAEGTTFYSAHLSIPKQALVALEERSADLASVEEAPQIQEDTQIVTLAIPQKEIPKIKKSEILYKFDQLCAFFGSVKASDYPSSQQLQYPYKPLQLTTSPMSTMMPRTTLLKPDRNLEDQRTTPPTSVTPPPIPTLNSSSIRLGMNALHLAKKMIK